MTLEVPKEERLRESSAGIATQFTATKELFARGLWWWIARATSSLPVLDSQPVTSTVVFRELMQPLDVREIRREVRTVPDESAIPQRCASRAAIVESRCFGSLLRILCFASSCPFRVPTRHCAPGVRA
jgi:hypothetical protein